MYYKLQKGNPTYDALKEVWEKMQDYNKKALNLVEELGFKKFGINQDGVAGGISCFQSSEKPEGYKRVGREGDNLIYPRNNNKEVLSKINALPVVSKKEFNDTIGFKEQFSERMYHSSFGCKRVDDIFLIEVSNECDYTPAEGMIEITFTEYKEIGNNKELV